MEIGESLVGAYMRHVRHCDVVLFNTHLSDEQGELDIIGVGSVDGVQHVWLAEVTTHLRGMLYKSQANTVDKIMHKRDRARKFAAKTFAGAVAQFEVWSPIVPSGIVAGISAAGIDLIANEDYTNRINHLAAVAAASTQTTGDDAFRMLQVLTHLRGDRPEFKPPQ